jgi:hypothetical protein
LLFDFDKLIAALAWQLPFISTRVHGSFSYGNAGHLQSMYGTLSACKVLSILRLQFPLLGVFPRVEHRNQEYKKSVREAVKQAMYLPQEFDSTTAALPILMAAYPPTTTTPTVAQTEAEDVQTEMVKAIVDQTEEEDKVQTEVVAAKVGS